MNTKNNFFTIRQKVQRKLLHLRFQPIRVFCFHHVSDSFDESTMKMGDWLKTDVFKDAIYNLRNEGYTFISLQEAYLKLKHDVFRFRKYAVLTADDGWASLRNILPWLNEQHIPITLFLNPAYLDGNHFRERETEQYLSWDDVKHIPEQYPLVTIGTHGWDHVEVTKLPIHKFSIRVNDSIASLSVLSNYIPFYAFPYGKYTNIYINTTHQLGLVPLLVRGGKNYNYAEGCIDREVLGNAQMN